MEQRRSKKKVYTGWTPSFRRLLTRLSEAESRGWERESSRMITAGSPRRKMGPRVSRNHSHKCKPELAVTVKPQRTSRHQTQARQRVE